MRTWSRDAAPARVIAGVGAALSLVAVSCHLGVETRTIGQFRGPLMAVALDGLPPLALVYGGYRLRSAGLPDSEKWRVALWCLAGLVVAVAVLGLSIVIRQIEGRNVAEPAFVLLLTADAGGIAGGVAGYYNARARATSNGRVVRRTRWRSSTDCSATTSGTGSASSRGSRRPSRKATSGARSPPKRSASRSPR